MTAEMSAESLVMLGDLRKRLLSDINEERACAEYYRGKGLERDAEECGRIVETLEAQMAELDAVIACIRIKTREEPLSWEKVSRAIRRSGMCPSDFAHAARVPPLSVGLLKKGKPISAASRRNLKAAVRYWGGGCM